jgi:hypothetical protein
MGQDMNGRGIGPWVVRTAAAAAAAVAVPVTGSCIYLDPINERPVARITRVGDPPFHLGDTVRFDASKSTDDGPGLEAEWLVLDCTPTCVARGAPVRRQVGELLSVQIETKGRLQVQLRVIDRHGARSEPDIESIDVLNQPPEVELQVAGLRVAGIPLRAFARAEDPDGDDIELTWQLFAPSGSNPNAVSFTRIADDEYELVPDVSGVWQIRVTADDGDGGIDQADQMFLVDPDHPPCVAITDPPAVPGALYLAERANGPRRFAVLRVDDALDPHPPPEKPASYHGQAGFSWRVASPDTSGALVALSGHAAADYLLDPASFAPGDRFTVQVEVADRVPRSLPCDPTEPTCALDDPSCLQRVTWEVEIR